MNTFRWSTDQTFSNTEDGDMVTEVIPGNLIIAAGVTVTTQYRCKGLHIQVMGNCYVYGTIDMTSRGGNITGQNVGLEFFSDRNLITYDDAGWASLPSVRKIPATDGTAVRTHGPGNKLTYNGVDGGAASNGGCGAGGSGSMISDADGDYSLYSLVGTSFSGGCGSGFWSWLGAGTAPVPPAGSGGLCYDPTVGGDGAGNHVSSNPDPPGKTAGLLILSVLGFLYIDSSGIIKSNGGKGGNVISAEGYGGGSSGGGSVNILYGAVTNDGTVQANGGVSSTGSVYGGAGGAGSVRSNSLRVT
jgi:hypothetical protein